jgi:hypothetical protein
VNITFINININTVTQVFNEDETHIFNISVTCDCPLTLGLGNKCITFSQLNSCINRFRILNYALATVLTNRCLAASNNCALYNLYYLVLFALNARSNPDLAGNLVIMSILLFFEFVKNTETEYFIKRWCRCESAIIVRASKHNYSNIHISRSKSNLKNPPRKLKKKARFIRICQFWSKKFNIEWERGA